MTGTTTHGRAFVLDKLGTDQDEFELILEVCGIEDSDAFTANEVDILRTAANQLRSQSKSHSQTPQATYQLSPSCTSTASSVDVVDGFVDVYARHLEEQKVRVEAGMNAALFSYEQWLIDRSTQFFAQVNQMRIDVFLEAAKNPQVLTPRTIAALADNVGVK